MADHHARPVGWLLGAAGIVALVTVGIVLRFGLVTPPELASVDDASRPDRPLAIMHYDGERGQCLDIVDPDGTVRDVRCSLDGGPLVGWDDRGILMLRYAPFGERLEILDPATGGVVSSLTYNPREVDPSRWSTLVVTERDGGTLRVLDDRRQVLWQVDSPDSYRIDAWARDPASGTVALLDTAQRLLVLPMGAAAPLVWVADLGYEYGELVWQGTPLTAD